MSHDYEPHWDYPVIEDISELDNLSKNDLSLLHACVAKAQALNGPLGFEQPLEVFFTGQDGFDEDIVGVYCQGTSSRPIIVIDPTAIRERCDSDSDFVRELLTTIGHEAGHAYQDQYGGLAHEEGIEDDAEAFGREWAESGAVNIELLDKSIAPIKDYDSQDFFWHVTTVDALPSILQDGLQPQIGPRSEELGESVAQVYMFGSREDMDNALSNWLGESLEDEELAIIAIARKDAPSATHQEGQFEWLSTQAIGQELFAGIYTEEMKSFPLDELEIDAKSLRL